MLNSAYNILSISVTCSFASVSCLSLYKSCSLCHFIPFVCLWVCLSLSWGVWWSSGWLFSGDRSVLSEGSEWSEGCCDSGGCLDWNFRHLSAANARQLKPGSYPSWLDSPPGRPLFDNTAVDKNMAFRWEDLHNTRKALAECKTLGYGQHKCIALY